MNCSESLKALVPALAKARAGFTSIQKTKVNPHYKSKYAPLDEVLDSVMPALAQHGLVVVQPTSITDGRTVLHTRLLHESGEWMEGVYPLPDISDPQKLGIALTYARRYSICSLLSVAAEDDDDGNGASGVGDRAPSSTSKPASKPAAKLASVPSPSLSPNLISEEQVKAIGDAAKASGYTPDGMKALAMSYGFRTRKDITTDAYDEILAEFSSAESAIKWNQQTQQQAS